MKRLLLLLVGLSLASTSVGCCWRNRCCRPACDPCGGGAGGGMMAPTQQTIPYGAVPTGSLTPAYGAVAPSSTAGMPVASANTTYYPSAQVGAQQIGTPMGYPAQAAPTVAGLPVNPLPTF